MQRNRISVTREPIYRLKFLSVIDLIVVSMSHSSKGVMYHNRKRGLFFDMLSHQLSKSNKLPLRHSSGNPYMQFAYSYMQFEKDVYLSYMQLSGERDLSWLHAML